jgi:hypothetical protein
MGRSAILRSFTAVGQRWPQRKTQRSRSHDEALLREIARAKKRFGLEAGLVVADEAASGSQEP